MVVAYFDESERLKAGDPLSVGGFIFKPTDYRQFCRKWRHMLAAAPAGPLPYFHMTDLWAGRQSMARRTIPQRLALLEQATELVYEHTIGGVCVTFYQQEFESVAPPNWPQVFGSIYTAACQSAVLMTSKYMEENRGLYEPIHYFFESGHKFDHEAATWLKGLSFPSIKKELRYHGHTFADKAQLCGLQAADLMAWMGSRVATLEKPTGAAAVLSDPLGRLLVRSGPSRFMLDTLTGARLKDLIDLIAQRMQTDPEDHDRMLDPGPRKRRFR